jgi:hypothetical protein
MRKQGPAPPPPPLVLYEIEQYAFHALHEHGGHVQLRADDLSGAAALRCRCAHL